MGGRKETKDKSGKPIHPVIALPGRPLPVSRKRVRLLTSAAGKSTLFGGVIGRRLKTKFIPCTLY